MWLKLIFFSLTLLAVRHAIAEDDECTENGHTCFNCTTSQFCFQLPTGEWIEETITCAATETCHENDGRCTASPNPSCMNDNYKFVCRQTGLFPHAYDCTKYFACKRVENSPNAFKDPIEMSCPVEYVYDSTTTLCKKKDSNECKVIEGICERIGDGGGIYGNPYMHYVCLPEDGVPIPQLFYCDNNEKYDSDKKACKPPNNGIDAEGNCVEVGHFYDKEDCKKFFDCKVVGEKPVPGECVSDEFFDSWLEKCVPYECKTL